MPAIVKELIIAAAPQLVWGAITEPDEIVQWWAYEARVKPEVGSLAEFRFRQGAFVMQFPVNPLIRCRSFWRSICRLSRSAFPT